MDEGTVIDRMRRKRDAAAVLKVRLASIRGQTHDGLVFVVEGPEDKTVYFHWLRQLAPLLHYEILVCNGKGKLLAFRELLHRDLTGLKKGVYFLVDHDFDGLRGQTPGLDVYVTETYSVENHLVNERVLDHILCIEFHCNGEPATRTSILDHFTDLYDKFLAATKPINHRIFLARRIGIQNTKAWPDRVNSIAKVSLDRVSPSDEALNAIICLEREPTALEIARLDVEFAALSPRQQYRGKFALAFFLKFLQEVAVDRASNDSRLFGSLHPQACNGGLSLDAIASKSTAPQTLKDFITAVTAAMDAPPLAAS